MTTPRRPNSPPWTPEQLAEAKALYAKGYGVSTIGKRFGCSPTTAWERLRAAGVQIRSRETAMKQRLGRRRWNDLWSWKAYRSLQAGRTLVELGVRYGVSANLVGRALRRYVIRRATEGRQK